MKLIEVNADAGHIDTVGGIAEKNEAADFRLGYKGDDGRQIMRILIADERAQAVLDALQKSLGKDTDARIIVIGVEVALPRPPEKDGAKEESAKAIREAMYEEIEKSARLDSNFLILVVLSQECRVLPRFRPASACRSWSSIHFSVSRSRSCNCS